MNNLHQELRRAKEGLEQMQQPDAGYFADPENKQPEEIRKYNHDVKLQAEGIDRLEKKITREAIVNG